VPFDLRALRLLVYKRGDPNPGFSERLARALCETEKDSRNALPVAIATFPRAFERACRLGGRFVKEREFERVADSLKDVPATITDAALKRNIRHLSSKTQSRIVGEMFRAEALKTYASSEVLQELRTRMGSMGRNFPDCLLAEVMYALDTSTEHETVYVLVETGFARDLVEANIIFDVVEWAMGQSGL
jgi:Arc/MetJ family transcription regulator